MITQFKLFENNSEPEVGDYVYGEYDDQGFDEDFENFIKSNFGQIIEIKRKLDTIYSVKYENVPDNIQNMFFKLYDDYYTGFEKNDIKFFSPNKEDIEAYLQVMKYNL